MNRLGSLLLQSEGWPADAELDFWLCSDDEIADLNREHRGKPGPTDVLSFPQFEPGERPTPGLPVALGDVVISAETAARQAEERGVSFETEIAWLFTHATLHLLGYDDDTEEGLRDMIARAENALAQDELRRARI